MQSNTLRIITKYKRNVFIAAMTVLKNEADADDIVQETFIAYHFSNIQFQSDEHIKSWLLKVAINKSKNIRKSFWNRNKLTLQDYMEKIHFKTDENKYLFEEVMKLPDKYRIVIYLFYYEDYSIKQIASILNIGESNVGVRLSRAREQLKHILKEDGYDIQ